MRFPSSIRFSLTLWYTLTLAVVMLLFSSFVYLTIRADIYKESDREIQTLAEALASPTMEPFRMAAPSVFDQVLEDFFGPKIDGKFVQLFDQHGTVTAASKNLNQMRLPLSLPTFQKVAHGKVIRETQTIDGLPPMRIVTMPVFADQKLVSIVQVGTSLNEKVETLRKLLIVFCISIPLGILFLCGGGWFLAGQALKPVDLITRSAQRITAENLSQRLVVLNPNDEIGRLAETFNSTLERLEASFNRTRRFFTDISHELRTPLTIIRGEAEVGLKWAKEPEEFREIIQSTLDEVKWMSGIVESLLELSRAEEGGLHLEMQELDLCEFLATLVHELNQQAQLHEQGKVVDFIPAGQAWVQGDQRRLRQIFMNLLDNALKFTPADTSVRVELTPRDGSVSVAVIDKGPGIPPDDLPHIFERFYRVDKARNRSDGGSGLGLSLVKTLTEAHSGWIEVSSSSATGSTFVVSLPTIPVPQPIHSKTS